MTLEAQIISYIGEYGPMPSSAITAHFGRDPQAIDALLRHLLDLKFIEVIGDPQAPRYRVVGKHLRVVPRE